MTNTIVKTMEDIDQRERRTFSARVPTAQEMSVGMVDYATAFTRIEQAMKHLKRAVPNGQAEACKIAAAELATGMAQTFAYLVSVVPDFQAHIDGVIETRRADAAAAYEKHSITGV